MIIPILPCKSINDEEVHWSEITMAFWSIIKYEGVHYPECENGYYFFNYKDGVWR
jgi:hypothetical protein